MYSFFRIFFTGLTISLLGTLPLGTLNVTSLQVALTDGFLPAVGFALGVLLVEMVYVRITLAGIEWLRKKERWLLLFDRITIALMIALAIASFYAALSPGETRNVLIENSIPRFWLGVLLSALNPVQIPFWLGWSSVLYAKNILKPANSFYYPYLAGIGSGTFAGHLLFIFSGRWMVDSISGYEAQIQAVIGFIFAGTALMQIIRLRSKNRKIITEGPRKDSDQL
jgi:threonine/homoserine/homoserine lactone efflux protein